MKHGSDEGERCNRLNDDGFACDGEMELMPVSGCSCHISPPCSACVGNAPACTVCAKSGDEE
jgi:hypothetical protein